MNTTVPSASDYHPFGDTELGLITEWVLETVFKGSEYNMLDEDGIAEAAERAVEAGRLNVEPGIVGVDIQAAITMIAKEKNFNTKMFPFAPV